MSLGSLQSLVEKAKHYNTINASRARHGKPLSKGHSLLIDEKVVRKIAEDLVALWGQVGNDSPAYQKVERDRLPLITRKWGWSHVKMSSKKVLDRWDPGNT